MHLLYHPLNYLSVHPPTQPHIQLSIHQPTHQSANPPTHPSIYQSHPTILPSTSPPNLLTSPALSATPCKWQKKKKRLSRRCFGMSVCCMFQLALFKWQLCPGWFNPGEAVGPGLSADVWCGPCACSPCSFSYPAGCPSSPQHNHQAEWAVLCVAGCRYHGLRLKVSGQKTNLSNHKHVQILLSSCLIILH